MTTKSLKRSGIINEIDGFIYDSIKKFSDYYQKKTGRDIDGLARLAHTLGGATLMEQGIETSDMLMSIVGGGWATVFGVFGLKIGRENYSSYEKAINSLVALSGIPLFPIGAVELVQGIRTGDYNSAVKGVNYLRGAVALSLMGLGSYLNRIEVDSSAKKYKLKDGATLRGIKELEDYLNELKLESTPKAVDYPKTVKDENGRIVKVLSRTTDLVDLIRGEPVKIGVPSFDEEKKYFSGKVWKCDGKHVGIVSNFPDGMINYSTWGDAFKNGTLGVIDTNLYAKINPLCWLGHAFMNEKKK
ncbi:hypothetical protein J4474_00925 [Candidatus Pacearchaeota archaeon]|nr:hypothetical protein [Candidatus Pacearchaeota archaeon]